MIATRAVWPKPFDATDAERRRFGVRPALRPSEWAERFRIVTEGPRAGAGGMPWDNRIFPPGVAIMDAAVEPRFRRVLLMAAPQVSGKTAHAFNVLGYALHWRGADCLYFNANSARAESNYAKKLAPALLAQPELARLIPTSRDEQGTKEHHRYTNGASCYVTGSESEADLSGMTAPVIFGDDLHAFAATIGPHGHAFEFAEKRQAAYPPGERIAIAAGQAADVNNWLWKALLASTFYVLYLPCLNCGWYQLLDFERMVFDATDVESAGRDCWLRCANSECDHQIRHEELPAMLRRHAWVSTPADCNPVLEPGPRAGIASLNNEAVYPESARATLDAGFWWNAFAYPLAPWTRYAADTVAARDNPDSLRDIQMHVRVIPFTPPALEGTLDPEEMKGHREAEHHFGTVPARAGVHTGHGVLVVTVDVHKGWIWYQVRAWHKSSGASWVVRWAKLIKGRQVLAQLDDHQAARLASLKLVSEHLDRVQKEEHDGWPIVDDAGEVVGTARAQLCCVDQQYLGELVRRWCHKVNGGKWAGKWRPIAGSQAPAFPPKGRRHRKEEDVPLWPRYDRPNVVSRRECYWPLNVNRAKLYLHALLAIARGEPGYQALPSDAPPYLLDEFANQHAAEVYNEEKGRFDKVSNNNHLLDTSAYSLCAAVQSGVQLPGLSDLTQKTAESASAAPAQKNVRRARPPRVIDRRRRRRR